MKMIEVKRIKLSDISELITKGTTPTTLGFSFQDEGVNFLKIECFDEYGNFTKDKLAHISDECNDKLKRSQLKENDLLFSIAGAIGRVATVTGEMLPANTNQALAIIRINRIDVFIPYIKLILTSPIVREQFERQKQGVAQQNLSLKDIGNLKIPFPSISQQIDYANIFAKINSVILSRKNELHLLDDLVKARFVEMFGEKNHPENTLLNLCNIIDYRGKTPEKVDSGLPFITAKNVKMHYMTLEPREYISKETYDKVMVRGFPKEGDVVFTTEAPLGNVCRIPRFDTKFYIGQRIVTMQTEILNPIYLEYALSDESFKRKYMSKSTGSTVTGIRVRLLEQLTIPVPPTDLQNEFAEFVQEVDKSKVFVQKALDEAQLLFDSLMQQYFG